VLFRSNPQNPQGPLAARRDSPVVCHVCGHTVARASRRQKFCSTRCRQKYAVGKNGRGCVISDGLGQDSPDTTNPHFSLNKINGLQGRKIGTKPPDSRTAPRHRGRSVCRPRLGAGDLTSRRHRPGRLPQLPEAAMNGFALLDDAVAMLREHGLAGQIE
jgi:hypothetical protein